MTEPITPPPLATGGMSRSGTTTIVKINQPYAIGYFTQSQIADLRVEKAQLRLEKAELEANIADLHKRGGKIKMTNCGGRLCIEASTNQGNDAGGNPAPMGSWLTSDGRKVPLVIPRGY